MHSFVLAVVKCRERDAETVLVIVEMNVGTVRQMSVDVLSVLRTNRDIVNLEVFEKQRYRALSAHVHRVEYGQTVSAAKNDCSVGERT